MPKDVMDNPYVKQFPDLMRGKKIMYVHGFGSSGRSGTVGRLRVLLPSAVVVAPDLPVHPAEAVALLGRWCGQERPDLIIGTSMGGMYAEMLHGYDRILVNPAFRIGDTMAEHGMTGKQTFYSEREDGVQEFYVDKPMVKEYRAITQNNFTHIEPHRVWGLFGDSDPVVHTFDIFREHYPQAVSFHGEHRLNDKILVNSVVPVIRWIDDRQEGRERPVVYISISALTERPCPCHTSPVPDMTAMAPASGARKAVRMLSERYTLFFVAGAPDYDAAYVAGVQWWMREHIGVPAFGHLMFTGHKHLLYGDYLIDPGNDDGAADFTGTHIRIGDAAFKTWEEVTDFFGRLNGQ